MSAIADKEMTNAEFKATREALGLTSNDLAGLIGVQQATVTGWEAGIRPIPDKRADQLNDLVARFHRQVERLAGTSKEILLVPRNDAERTDTSTPARWQRQVALKAAQQSGKRIVYRERKEK